VTDGDDRARDGAATGAATGSADAAAASDGVSPLVARRRERVLDAVQPLLAEEGVDVTMEQLAEVAGIGRRTLFRYFDSREELIAAAVRRSFDQLLDEVFADPEPGLGPEEMVATVLRRTHAVAERMGRAHWQVATVPHSHPELGEAVLVRREARARYVERFTDELWRRCGRVDDPPRWLVDSFGLVESLFAHEALRRDLGRSSEEIVETTTTLMVAALRHALAT
jgi:AcrR family transcriptional regulator